MHPAAPWWHADSDAGDTGGDPLKPPLTIDLAGPDGNVFALVGKVCMTLDAAGQPDQAMALRMWFRTVPPMGGVSYDDVRQKVEEYCEVTWW